MARLVVEGQTGAAEDGGALVVRLSWREVPVARRRAVRVPRAEIKAVGVEPDWWRAVRGTPVTGRCRPGRYCVGERVHPSGRDFVAVRAGVPVVLVDLWRPVPFTRLAVSVPDAAEIARILSRHIARTDGLRETSGGGPPPHGSA
ncbi:hypothetical protein ACFYOV_26530 [Streptomyces sp. NPDC005931]|uniref:hypothetical protein n=1 Tax=Streptomyces sp. NPDC005931 TaxID=3364737 RepID=UPI0036845336